MHGPVGARRPPPRLNDPDAGTRDAGSDVGPLDAYTPDTGPVDAFAPVDAAMGPDAWVGCSVTDGYWPRSGHVPRMGLAVIGWEDARERTSGCLVCVERGPSSHGRTSACWDV